MTFEEIVNDETRDRWLEVEEQVHDWLDNTPDAEASDVLGVMLDEARRHPPLSEVVFDAPTKDMQEMVAGMYRAWRADRRSIPG